MVEHSGNCRLLFVICDYLIYQQIINCNLRSFTIIYEKIKFFYYVIINTKFNMKCIHLKQKMNRTFYCKKSKKLIHISKCNGCKHKEYKQYRPLQPKKEYKMKNKSSKLAKLEKNRFSVFTDNLDKCYLCPNKKDHLHEIFAGRNRQNSMKYGFVLPLCEKCHSKYQNDVLFNHKWYVICQNYFEKNIGAREEFIKIFRKSWL